MNKEKTKKVDSFRKQMAQSMAEMDSIMSRGESFSGDGRFTVRTIRVQQPHVHGADSIRAIRQRLGVSQAIFAQLLGVSQVLVRSWERGARTPAAIACRLLDIIRDNPQALTALILRDRAVLDKSARKLTAKRVTAPRRHRASAA